jgi:hypothetical protein
MEEWKALTRKRLSKVAELGIFVDGRDANGHKVGMVEMQARC